MTTKETEDLLSTAEVNYTRTSEREARATRRFKTAVKKRRAKAISKIVGNSAGTPREEGIKASTHNSRHSSNNKIIKAIKKKQIKRADIEQREQTQETPSTEFERACDSVWLKCILEDTSDVNKALAEQYKKKLILTELKDDYPVIYLVKAHNSIFAAYTDKDKAEECKDNLQATPMNDLVSVEAVEVTEATNADPYNL